MTTASTTRNSLLLRLRNPRDLEAWSQCSELYHPLIKGYLRKLGLQEADADDVTQIVFIKLVEKIRQFDYEPGRSFRGWLRTLTYYEFINWWRRQPRDRGRGDTGEGDLMQLQPDERQAAVLRDLEEEWDREYEQRVLQWALEKVRQEFDEATFEAFRLTALEGQTLAVVAKIQGVPISRVFRRKKELWDRLQAVVNEITGD
jgi:RNA polymerase sigma factor (sigma-70 family)